MLRNIKPQSRFFLFLVLGILVWVFSLKYFSYQSRISKISTISPIEQHANNQLKDVKHLVRSIGISESIVKNQKKVKNIGLKLRNKKPIKKHSIDDSQNLFNHNVFQKDKTEILNLTFAHGNKNETLVYKTLNKDHEYTAKQNTTIESYDHFNHINRNDPQNTLEFNNPMQVFRFVLLYFQV